MAQLDPLLYMMGFKREQPDDLTKANIVHRPVLRKAVLKTIPEKANTTVMTVVQAIIKFKSGLRQRRQYEQVPTEVPGSDIDAEDGNELQTPEAVEPRELIQTDSEVETGEDEFGVQLQEFTGSATDLL